MNMPAATSNNVGTSAIFLWEGMTEEGRQQLAEFHGGQIGLADWLSSLAEIVERKFDELLPDDLPGVYHYEVVEPMGLWLCSSPLMDQKSFEDELEHRTQQFLASGQPAGGN